MTPGMLNRPSAPARTPAGPNDTALCVSAGVAEIMTAAGFGGLRLESVKRRRPAIVRPGSSERASPVIGSPSTAICVEAHTMTDGAAEPSGLAIGHDPRASSVYCPGGTPANENAPSGD